MWLLIIIVIILIALLISGARAVTGGAVARVRGVGGHYVFRGEDNDAYIIPKMQRSGGIFDWKIVEAAYRYAGGTVIDVGANIGTFSIPLARRARRVIAFEPQPQMYAHLRHNIRANRVNVDARPMVVGHAQMTVHLGGHERVSERVNWGGRSLGVGGEKVRMTTIDSLDLKGVSLIKIDVEGAEPLVIYGARYTIESQLPVIIFEKNEKKITEDMRTSMNLSPEVADFSVEGYLRGLGYRIQELATDNFIAIHNGNSA